MRAPTGVSTSLHASDPPRSSHTKANVLAAVTYLLGLSGIILYGKLSYLHPLVYSLRLSRAVKKKFLLQLQCPMRALEMSWDGIIEIILQKLQIEHFEPPRVSLQWL